MSAGRKPTALEARRANGEQLSTLPVLVGGRPAEGELDTPPAGLDRWAKAAWREVVPYLVSAKLIDRGDVQAVESYALHMGRARALREEIEWEHWEDCECPSEARAEGLPDLARLGAATSRAAPPAAHVRGCRLGKRRHRRTLRDQFVTRSVRGYTSNPLLMQEREALREARMIGELLGLNPVGRTRLVGKQPKGRGLAGLTANLPRPALTAVPDP